MITSLDHFYDKLVRYCNENGVVVFAYSEIFKQNGRFKNGGFSGFGPVLFLYFRNYNSGRNSFRILDEDHVHLVMGASGIIGVTVKIDGPIRLRKLLELLGISRSLDQIQNIYLDRDSPIRYHVIDGCRKKLITNENLVDHDSILSAFDKVNMTHKDGNVSIIDGSTHRVSFFPTRQNARSINVRISRFITYDPLPKHENQNVLIIGRPSTGKTSLMRHVAKTLSKTMIVDIIDLVGELGSRGVIGLSRVLSSSTRTQQQLLDFSVKFRSPEAIVIDEVQDESCSTILTLMPLSKIS